MLEVYTMKGSRVIARMAGIESTANMRSVDAITIMTGMRAVAISFPSRRTKKFGEVYSVSTGTNRLKNLSTGFFPGSTSTSPARMSLIAT